MNKRRLYCVTGVAVLGSTYEVDTGLVFATSEEEARGSHMRSIQDRRPGYLVHSVLASSVPDALVLEAAREIAP